LPVEIPMHKYDPIASYVANLSRGPILLTAPHSNTMFRGGPFMGQTTRGHRREHWASTIVLQLADAIEDI
jgi:hypothetical protein